MSVLAPIRKALVPAAVAAVLALLAYLGVEESISVKEAVTLLITAVLVYFIPNEPARS